jgi:hypothetical protein
MTRLLQICGTIDHEQRGRKKEIRKRKYPFRIPSKILNAIKIVDQS